MNVVFVNMPFSAIRPAIGASLLKSHLKAIGVPSRVAYPNMRFAQLLGPTDYEYIAERAPTQILAGDWVFSECLFGRRDEADRAYLRAFRERFEAHCSCDGPIATLQRARSLAEPFIDECLSEFDWQSYSVVGFTSTFTQHVAALALARRLKERFPELVIIFGGANCEDVMGLQLHRSFSFIDFVCGGEADLSFPHLIEALEGGADCSRLPGVISRRQGSSVSANLAPERVLDLDALPYPDYDDYFEQRAALNVTDGKPVGVLMETSRGCWWGEKHHCTFCGLNGTSMAFRSKSATRVLDEIAALRERYQPDYIEMVDNILDMHYFHDLLPELKRRQLKLGLFYETKANLSKEQLRTLRDAGVLTIQPGIESFSTDVLRLMRKGTSAMQNVQLLKWCKELGIKVYWNLLYGFPGEDPDAYRQTARTIESIAHLEPPFGTGAIRLDRFSPNFFSAAELGLCNVRPDRSYGYVYDLPVADLVDLAYYFEHDYADGRDPESYVGEVMRAVRNWREQPESRDLVYADHGETLAVWDLRAHARQTLTVLSGDERALYLFCDQYRSLQKIEAYFTELGSAKTEIAGSLERFVGSRLMIKLDDRYLSLAIPAPITRSNGSEAGQARSRRPDYAAV